MSRKRIWTKCAALLCVAALICTALLSGCAGETPAETLAESTAAEESVYSRYFTHYYLNAKNRGDCRELKGKVLITFFLVSDDDSRWDTASVKKLKEAHENAKKLMVSEAASYGVTLEVTLNYIRCTVEGSFGRDNHRNRIGDVFAAAGFSDKNKVSRTLEQKYEVDAAPLLICVNRSERSFATNNKTDVRGLEYAVLFGKNEDFRHELYHLFGAKDLYPKSVKTLGQMYFPTSVMLDSSLVVDDLTAYLMGWTETASEKVIKFLDATWHINSSNFKDADD